LPQNNEIIKASQWTFIDFSVFQSSSQLYENSFLINWCTFTGISRFFNFIFDINEEIQFNYPLRDVREF
jgi:hypothetical protein